MKQLFTLLMAMLPLLCIEAQDEYFSVYPDPPSVIARFNLVTPSFIIEFAPANHFTFTTGILVTPNLWPENEHGDREFDPTPGLKARFLFEPRYYFNLENRYNRGKRTDYYSGWYVGMPFSIVTGDLKFSVGAVAGFQCTFGRRWYWNFGLGPAYSYKDDKIRPDVSVDTGFGIILN